MNEPSSPMTLRRDDSAPVASTHARLRAPVSAAPRAKSGFFARPITRNAKTYRADIDGLRAIAVISVILMHAGISAVSGGFLGVDVFFVISGYLVHQQVTSRLATHSFSLFGFYGRRIRRTFPALYLVAALSLAVGALLLMPGDLTALAQSAIAAALGASNILFATQAGYFDHSAITKPLLHSWSLGVEEQYYLLAPLIPLALRNLSANLRRTILLILFALDLAFCVVVQHLIPEITFFMMPPRLWEFLLGSLVADGLFPALKRQWLAEAIGAAALVALLASLMTISGEAAHPGLITLIPCVATALLIQLGGTNVSLANRILSLAPLTFCGLISYSLYLWHWPLIVFARYADLTFNATTMGIGAVLLFVVSAVSWKYVETPFRNPASLFNRRAVLILLIGLSLIAGASTALISARGWQTRFSPEVAAITSYYDYADRRDYREGTCFVTSRYNDAKYFDRATCLQKSAAKPNYLLIGDSHGAHFWAGLSRIFPNINLLQATASGCKPVLGAHGLHYCVDLMHQILVDYLPTAKLDGIIFSAAWNDEDIAPLQATLAYAKRFVPKIIVLGDVPSHEIDLPNLLGRSLVEHRPEMIIAQQSRYPWIWNEMYRKAIAPEYYVSLVDLLCPEHRCAVYAGKDIPLQFDTSHLTTEGSIFVAKKLAELPIFAPLVSGASQITH